VPIALDKRYPSFWTAVLSSAGQAMLRPEDRYVRSSVPPTCPGSEAAQIRSPRHSVGRVAPKEVPVAVQTLGEVQETARKAPPRRADIGRWLAFR
jgi:hypothetical protein